MKARKPLFTFSFGNRQGSFVPNLNFWILLLTALFISAWVTYDIYQANHALSEEYTTLHHKWEGFGTDLEVSQSDEPQIQ